MFLRLQSLLQLSDTFCKKSLLGSDYVPQKSPSILIYSQYLLSAYHVQGTVLSAMHVTDSHKSFLGR